MDLDARPYLGESATQSGFFCHQDSDHLAATAQHGPEDLGVGIAQRAQRRGGPPPQQASYTPPFGGLGVREPVFQFEFPSPKGGGPIEGAAKGQQRGSKGAAKGQGQRGTGRFHRRKAVAPLKVSRCRSPVPGGSGPGGLSLAAGTSQAPQLVAPEANIRRDDHRGLHDARRRFNLAKSHGAR